MNANSENNDLDLDSKEQQAESLEDIEPISYFGADFDVFGLVRRLNNDDIVVPSFDPAVDTGPGAAQFQRKFVWKRPQMDKFVESLLLGFPVPGIFLVQQQSHRLLVLDGQQRLRTLEHFYSGVLPDGEPYELEYVEERFRGRTYETLDEDERRQLDNTFIHATVIKQSSDPEAHDSIYYVFERLNTGGTSLYPHEIRVALYQGSLVEGIRDLNSHRQWRTIFGPDSHRLKDQELILRFFAFWKDHARYKRPLKGFLNEFLARNQNISKIEFEEFALVFRATCDLAAEAFGEGALKAESRQVNAALADAVLFGLSMRLEQGPISDLAALREARAELLADEDFQTSITRATADEARVQMRLELAKRAFGEVA
ncbi:MULTISPECIES: DUF262 domain-containing protein [Glycomyces]|uniref:DUF262 domain-containing protein n=2 Tax=Glycomyces TaxID=58113 RepID=A0A9X3SZR5_9ACTN|nr:DUF262 domain-containing protein [Glycomyces lechevalierae]MDA1387676.1 DUF262 domain-containing protein [Glycomyces lechevalierae]MDR7337993.1 hypothetical protein [Glycomyces lechevalierae]